MMRYMENTDHQLHSRLVLGPVKLKKSEYTDIHILM